MNLGRIIHANSGLIARVTMVTSKTHFCSATGLSCNTEICNRKLIYPILKNQANCVSTYEVKTVPKEPNFIMKALKKIPFLNVQQTKLRGRGYILYEEIADKIDYIGFFNQFNLPDTFFSWFSVTELHVWMLSLRVMAEGDNGRVLRNSIIEALWIDVGQRVKKLGAGSPSSLRRQITELSEQMQAAFIAYDEGIQSSDTVLAGAIWRRLYNMEHVDPHNLEKLVKYVRKQVAIFDTLPTEALMTEKSITWESFKND